MRKFLLDMRRDFLIMSNFYLVEIVGERNSLTIVTSKKILKISNYVLVLSFFFSLKLESGICNAEMAQSQIYKNIKMIFYLPPVSKS